MHVAIAGLDKLIPTLDQALTALLVLPRNATAQRLTSYVTWMCGAGPCASAPGNKKIMHVVFLDNGRTEIAKDPLFSQISAACAAAPAPTSVRCSAWWAATRWATSTSAPSADPDLFLPRQGQGQGALPELRGLRILRQCLRGRHRPAASDPRDPQPGHGRAGRRSSGGSPGLGDEKPQAFHSLLKFAKYAQKPFTGGTQFQRHLPAIFLGKHGFKALPAIANKSFRDRWPEIAPKAQNPTMRVAIFSGCAQDFVYPEQLEACVKILAAKNVEVEFPMEQTCCGLPLE